MLGAYGPGLGGIPNRRPGQQTRGSRDRDVLLTSNPDFEVPGRGMRVGGGGGGRGGRGMGMGMGQQGQGGASRYPGGDV